MRNLSKTIDRILKIEPNLEGMLIPIKEKWDRGPRRKIYWKQLFNILNSEISPTHPRRVEIQNLFINKIRKVPRKSYTFENASSVETVVGIIPENMESQVRRNDRMQIELAKLAVEARLTHNEDLMLDVNRRTEKLDIAQKKIWYDIKNHFNIWKVNIPTSFFIRSKGSLLSLTSIRIPASSQASSSENFPESYMIRMDNETLKRFLKYLNISPPPGFSSSENESD